MDDVTILDRHTDLCYSPDDEGWYLQDYVSGKGGDRTSQLFNTKEQAIYHWRHSPQDIEWT